jgi:hypothetical protein
MSSRSAAVLIGHSHARGPNLIYTRRLYAEGSLIYAAMARTLSQSFPPRESVPNLFHALYAPNSTLSGYQDRLGWKIVRNSSRMANDCGSKGGDST